ncbi:MAG TPA: cell surface protein SprA, partial [Rhodothermia bacterium]
MTIPLVMRMWFVRLGWCVAAVLLSLSPALAQIVEPPDSTAAGVDSTVVQPDTLVVPPDSLFAPADTLIEPSDSLDSAEFPDTLDAVPAVVDQPLDSLAAPVDTPFGIADSVAIPLDAMPGIADSMSVSPDSSLGASDSLAAPPDSLTGISDSLAVPRDTPFGVADSVAVPIDNLLGVRDSAPTLLDSLAADTTGADSTRSWRLAERYLGSLGPDSYMASPFPRRKRVLLPGLGGYWRHEIRMDTTGSRYIAKETVGGQNVRFPLVLSPDEYRAARLERDRDEAFRNLIVQRAGRRGQGGRGLGLNIVVPGGQQSAFTTIFGKPEVDLRVNGQVNIDAGFSYQKSDQRISLSGNEGQLDPDFGQNIRLGITGSIGDKLRIDVNWDTERTFDFQNQLKLEYTGYEDDIVKKVVAGNVFLQTPSSLIQGGQRLFGIRTDWQLGAMRLTSVVSQQEGQAEDLEIEGGAQTTEFDLRPTDYDD